MNQVFLIGNLTKDPELRKTASGLSVCTFTLAVTRKYKDSGGRKQSDFISVVVWRDQADHCARYLSKGRKCAVIGELNIDSYDGRDGQKKYRTQIVASSVEFLASANQDNTPRQELNSKK